MRSLTVKTHSDSKREYEYFQAILTLAGAVLNHAWTIVEGDPADVVIIAFDSTEPYSAWDEYAGRYPAERLVAYTDAKPAAGMLWHLPRPPEAMPRLSEVVQILNKVADYFKQAEAQPILAQPVAAQLQKLAPQAAYAECFRLNQHLAGIIEQAIRQNTCLVCRLPGYPTIYLCPPENAVYTAADPMALAVLCRAEIGELDITELTEAELREEVADWGLAKRRTLSECLWFSILAGSNGRILADCRLDDAVYLREWPGHARLSFYGLYHDIATEMAAGMASLKEIAARSGAPLQNVVDFHNACAYQGLMARGDEGRWLAGQKAKQRAALRAALLAHCGDGIYLKLVLVGCVGSGKTTALTTLSETPPLLTEASPSDAVATQKPTTTVAMEYGEVRFGADAKLQIYGTPGQRRFDFMGQILCGRAWGLLILIDNTGTDPFAELAYYLDHYAVGFSGGRVAVGVSHYDAKRNPTVDEYKQFLRNRDCDYPVGVVDARESQSLVVLIAALASGGSTAPGLG
ncbi:MAG: GTP-binding protein [Candidatus Methylumidiphilus sp.]